MIRTIRLITPKTAHDETMRIFTSHTFVIIGAFTWTMQVLPQHQHLDLADFRLEARRRHKSRHHSHGTAASRTRRTPRPRPHPGTPRPRHDGHGHDMTDGHDVATTCTATIAYKGTCPRDTTRHAKTQSHKRSNVAPCNKHPRGGVSPRHKKQGRWLSSADAECSLEHFWITRYLRGLHIFSGCNRFCTLHIVYNGLWIDVDDGRA